MSTQAKRPDDAVALQRLRQRGDDLVTPRHTLAFFYIPEEDKREPEVVVKLLAPRLLQRGWSLVSHRGPAIVFDSVRPADVGSVDAMSVALQAIADEINVEYVGWNCAVVQKR